MERREMRLLVRRAMEDSRHRPKDAKNLLVHWSDTNTALRAALLQLGADEALRLYITSERSAAFSMAHAASMVPGIRVETPETAERRQERTNRREFWDRYALFGQMPLREATRPDLRTSVDSRRKQAAGNIACANFESAVAKKLPNDEAIVSRVLKVDTLMQLARKHHVIRAAA